MGAIVLFHCPACGYQAEVSGGLDYGWLGVTHTVSCPLCRELSDMLICDTSQTREAWAFDSLFTEVSLDELMRRLARAHLLPTPIRCRLDESHEASLWRPPGPCPRCGAILIAGEITILWD